MCCMLASPTVCWLQLLVFASSAAELATKTDAIALAAELAASPAVLVKS